MDCFRSPLGAKRPANEGPRGFQTELKRRLEQKNGELAESLLFPVLFRCVFVFVFFALKFHVFVQFEVVIQIARAILSP